MTSSVHETIAVDLDLIDLYKDLHSHPELGFQEQRTSSLVERHLTALGFETTTDVGTTGVVGVLKNGVGPTALLRADMDALPVREETGLDYASTVTTTDDQGKTVSVSHACAVTTWVWMSESMAYPPPKVKIPMTKKVEKSCR